MAREYVIEQLSHGCKVWDFMRWHFCSFGISTALLIGAIVIITTKSFNLGLDFTGGMLIEITLEKLIDMDKMSKSLQKAGFRDLLLQSFGSSGDIIVRMPSVHDIDRSQELGFKVADIINKTTNQNITIKRIDFVGPSIGEDLVQNGAMALIVMLIAILIYISFRFEWRLATGVVMTLVHDIVITMGVLSLFHIEIDMTILASLMSIIGYSLNDSIVVLDRIRENFRKIYYGTPYEIINVSLTQTLYRTLITSSTTLMVILMLYVFGGAVLKGFSLTMLIGISIGTVSSIYVTSALALQFGVKREHLLLQKVEKEGADQTHILP